MPASAMAAFSKGWFFSLISQIKKHATMQAAEIIHGMALKWRFVGSKKEFRENCPKHEYAGIHPIPHAYGILFTSSADSDMALENSSHFFRGEEPSKYW